jgi:hypothetical protein
MIFNHDRSSIRVLSLLLFLCAPALGQQLPAPQANRVPADIPVQSSVWDAVELSRSLTPAQVRSATGDGFVGISDDGFVHVEIVGSTGTQPLPPATLAPFGARIEASWRNHMDLWLPLDRVEACARSLPAGFTILRASADEPDDVAGEGPAAIGSDSYRDGGADGTGMTIAVIDGSYGGLTAARANGDAPTLANTTLVNYSSDPNFESGNGRGHGTGCVEAAFDHCPGATWRIYRAGTAASLGLAVDDCIANGVDVITRSLSAVNTPWEDDSGVRCEAATLAAENGILFFASAGNQAQDHWQGDFNGGGGDADWHDFAVGDETINVTIWPAPSATEASVASLHLAWDTSGGTHDLDLYVYDSNMFLIGWSTSSGEIYEEVQIQNGSTTNSRLIHVKVRKSSGGGTEFELFGFGRNTWNEHIVSAGSTTSPSNTTNQSVISVGAVAWNVFGNASPSIKAYSGQGPSNSNMTLPDLVGPTDTTNSVGTFTGTSSSTPNVAGAACAFWSQRPGYSNHAIRWLMYQHGLVRKDWGDPGNDNTFGFGGANLWPHAWGTRWLARGWGNITNASTGPAYTVQGAYDAVASGGRILIFPGGNYPEVPIVMTKALMIQTVVNAALIGGS